jgi:anti-sigma factor ChrR (cupin superfamily)
MTTTSPENTTATLLAHRPEQLPWAPWAIKGTSFKLLSADAATGCFSLLIRLDKGAPAPRHRHVRAVEGLVLEGGFHYSDDPGRRFTVGCYLRENDGAMHQPVSPEGAVMFAVFHGPVEGLDEEGNVTGRIDWRWHVETWSAHLARCLPATD